MILTTGVSEWRSVGYFNQNVHQKVSPMWFKNKGWTLILFLFHQVLKCLNQIVQNFPNLTEDEFMSEFAAFYCSLPRSDVCGHSNWKVFNNSVCCSYCWTTLANFCNISESMVIHWRYRRCIWGNIWFWWCRNKPWVFCYSGSYYSLFDGITL